MKTHDIDAAVRGLAPTHADERISDGAWTQLSENVTSGVNEPVISLGARRGPARPRLLLAAACTLLIAGVVGATLVNRPDQDQPQALSFTPHGDKIVVRVVDLNADPKRYNAEFKKMGLDIKLTVVPVSPPFVGQMVSFSGRSEHDMNQLNRLEPGELCNGTLNASDPGCQDGLEVPKNYDGHTEIQFGRAAKPGEMYQHMSGSATEKGEALAGLKIRNKTVAEVLPLVEARGVKVDFRTATDAKPSESVPGTWYVHDATSYVSGLVSLFVGPKPEK